MNKAKLVNFAEQVLTDVDNKLKKQNREYLETKLCEELSRIFHLAKNYIAYDMDGEDDKYKKAYESVKPILDEAIDNCLGDRK
tara:strand:- start:5068 stop:5316 length:249 start_codon:yes stop_codon:yes gene_type:complete